MNTFRSTPWRVTFGALSLLVAIAMLTGCETTPDPRDGPTADDVSSIPWNRQESWEGNPYGGTFQGTR